MPDNTLRTAEQRLHVNDLLDVYGALLTEKQRTAAHLYYREDLSLAEIADLLSISRQGVLDSIHRGVRQLEDTDEKLGLLGRVKTLEACLRSVSEDERVPREVRDRAGELVGD